ncbi:hypothetical protein C0Q70_13952 [Pomacea canaliculata]|uniref:Uncharacterized protein n=1 Tax=Pomacea canaliculata TaxID=400727 RepID=A0A2T7NYN7_POMCA|nr:hypothetical protein C0Q70_13952 [Pomacea canaliculata]
MKPSRLLFLHGDTAKHSSPPSSMQRASGRVPKFTAADLHAADPSFLAERQVQCNDVSATAVVAASVTPPPPLPDL